MDNHFEKEKEAFNVRARELLRSIPPPPGLRERILAGKPPSKVRKVSFWQPALAIAASLALLITAIFYLTRHPAEDRTFAGFQNRMTAFAKRQYSMDILTADLEKLRGFLTANGGPSDFSLPPGLRQVPVKGGAKLTWQNSPVSMVCFHGPGTKTLYLFIIDSSAVPGSAPVHEIKEVKGLATTSWNSSGNTYLLAAELPARDLQKYL